MNAVIYARYSCENQREESISGQLRKNHEEAKRLNLKVTSIYVDRAKTARNDNRPEFQRMIKELDKSNVSAVIVWSYDRFTRNRLDALLYRRYLSNRDVRLISCTEPLIEGPAGIFVESIIDANAEYYSASLSEKVKRGHKENALQILSNGGRLPLGYKIADRKFDIDKENAEIVQEIFARYIQGEEKTAIVRDLNTRFEGTHKFNTDRLTRILRNQKYTGTYVYNDTIINNAIPLIVSSDDFNRAQKLLNQMSRKKPFHEDKEEYFLSKTTLCNHCGASIIGESGTSKSKNIHRYYLCSSKKNSRGKCKESKAIRKNQLETIVLRACYDKFIRDFFDGHESSNLHYIISNASKISRTNQKLMFEKMLLKIVLDKRRIIIHFYDKTEKICYYK